jgi:ribonuclease HI
MRATRPHYLLLTESIRSKTGTRRWKFVLQSTESEERFAAADSEANSRRSRLELLAVVRGLEAIDCPARVTLLTQSPYVSRGIRRQLAQWREHKWCWERFGELVPILDQDLWQRVDRALSFHQVECCAWQEDDATDADFAGDADETEYSERAALRHARAYADKNNWNIAAVFGRLRRSVLTPFSTLWRPTFTRAA